MNWLIKGSRDCYKVLLNTPILANLYYGFCSDRIHCFEWT